MKIDQEIIDSYDMGVVEYDEQKRRPSLDFVHRSVRHRLAEVNYKPTYNNNT